MFVVEFSSEYRRIKRFVIRRRTLRCNWSGGKVEQLFGHGQLRSLQESLECVMCRLQKRVEMLGQIPDICYQHVSCFYSCHAPFIKQFKRCNEFHLTSSAGFILLFHLLPLISTSASVRVPCDGVCRQQTRVQRPNGCSWNFRGNI